MQNDPLLLDASVQTRKEVLDIHRDVRPCCNINYFILAVGIINTIVCAATLIQLTLISMDLIRLEKSIPAMVPKYLDEISDALMSRIFALIQNTVGDTGDFHTMILRLEKLAAYACETNPAMCVGNSSSV